MTKVARALSWCLIVLLNGACEPAPQSWLPSPVAGTSLNDMWGIGSKNTDNATRGKVYHYDGTTWSLLSLPVIDAFGGGAAAVASTGVHDAWVLAYQPLAPRLGLVRASPTGQAEDHSAEIIGTDGTDNIFATIASGGGGAFVLTRGGTAARLYRLVAGHFTAVAGADARLADLELLGVIGPDEFYGTTLMGVVHYANGVFTDLPYSRTGPIRMAFSSSKDVWFWNLANNAGGSGYHGDGDAWSEFTVLNWPSTGLAAGAAPLTMLPRGTGDMLLLATEAVGAGSAETWSLVSMHLDASGKAGEPQKLLSPSACDSMGVCFSTQLDWAVTLSDGTVMMTGGLTKHPTSPGASDWFSVKP